MCGIWCLLGNIECSREINVSKLLSRGPESLDIKSYANNYVTLGFTRLAINGLNINGMQPMRYKKYHWICNGEIYNWKELCSKYDIICDSSSDCAIIGQLWEKLNKNPTNFFRSLDGVFSLIIYDEENGEIIVGRDPYGIRPLFMGYSKECAVFASEMKAIIDVPGIYTIQHFLPGKWAKYSFKGSLLESGRYHSIPWIKNISYSPNAEDGLSNVCESLCNNLIDAVRKRVANCERPIGALLSGGIDSSLIASLVARELRSLGRGPLKTYSIGFSGSSDLRYARIVAEFIGSDHTEIIATPDQFFEAIPKVIYDIESYDITTVRASVGNWLICKYISENSDIKVVFNGDGSDEVFGSYLYFFRAPSDEEFEAESERLLEDIYKYDVLRSDRCISSHGLEARTPFLDKQFVAMARSIATIWRRPVKDLRPEKWILRKAFESMNILPNEVLWRQKEAFSDGVSGHEKSWFEEIQERVTNIQEEPIIYNHLPPISAESRYYRNIFNKHYGTLGENIITYFWMPKWSAETNDPSARTLSLYK